MNTLLAKAIPVAILMAIAAVFYASQALVPLHDDQITVVTTLLKWQDPTQLATDPLWGGAIFLQMNAIVPLMGALESLFGSFEMGALAGIVLTFTIYLFSAHLLFQTVTRDWRVSILLALLSTLQLRTPGATFWGFGDSTTFLSRTIYLPLVPIVFFFWLRFRAQPTLARCATLFVLVGLTSAIHQVSSLYLGLAFGLVVLLKYARAHPGWVLCGALSFLVGATPILWVLLSGSEAGGEATPAIQPIIESRYAWAFDVPGPFDLFFWLYRTPILIVIIIVAVLHRKEEQVRWLSLTAAALLLSAYVPYVLQLALWQWADVPFFFVELWRGFRFLPFIGCLILAVALRKPELESRPRLIAIGVLLLFTTVAFAISARSRLVKERPTSTCTDPITSEISKLPEDALVAFERIFGPERYCGRRGVYVTPEDGAQAFYIGADAIIAWNDRKVRNSRFFARPDRDTLAALVAHGVTHLVSKEPLPKGDWTVITARENGTLYRIDR